MYVNDDDEECSIKSVKKDLPDMDRFPCDCSIVRDRNVQRVWRVLSFGNHILLGTGNDFLDALFVLGRIDAHVCHVHRVVKRLIFVTSHVVVLLMVGHNRVLTCIWTNDIFIIFIKRKKNHKQIQFHLN